MRCARVSTASWASSPSARIVMVSPFLAPNVMIFNELLALASLSPFSTTISEENPLAAFTNCAAGLACKPSSGPTFVSLSATNLSNQVPPHDRGRSPHRFQSNRGRFPVASAQPDGDGLRSLFDRLDPWDRVLGEVRLGVDGERYPALGCGVVPARDLQRPLDGLGLHHHPETRGAAAHLDRDPYHLPTSLIRRRDARFRTSPPLLQIGTLDHLCYNPITDA